MKILLTVLLTALFVFALATAWVDYVQPNLKQASLTAPENVTATAESPVSRKRVRKPVTQRDPDPDPEPVPVPADEISPREQESRHTAVSRPLADQLEAVKRQEADLVARQENLQLIYDDIRSELATVDELRKQATNDLLESERRGLNSTATQTPPPALSSRKAPPLSSSDDNASRATALMLRRLVDEGKLATAASILKSLKQRDAARVLESMDAVDPRLADRLATIVQSGDNVIRR